MADAHLFGGHDLVGQGVLEHPIHVDAGFVGKGVGPHDSLVGLHRHAGDHRHQAAGRVNLLAVDVGGQPQLLLAGGQHHDHLLQGGVARPLADAVDAHLHLARPGVDPGQAVGHGQAQVVVAVHAHRGFVEAGHLLVQVA